MPGWEIINLVGIEPENVFFQYKRSKSSNSKGSEVCSNDKSQKILETVLEMLINAMNPSDNDGDNVNATTKTPSEACVSKGEEIALAKIGFKTPNFFLPDVHFYFLI